MAISVVEANSQGFASLSLTQTLTHTVSAGAGNLLLLVGISVNNHRNDGPTTVTGVTWDGTAMTSEGKSANSDDGYAEIWSLVNPATGTNLNIVSTVDRMDVSCGVVAGAITLDGVNQLTPIANFNSAIGNTTGPTIDIGSAADELVMDVVAAESRAIFTGVGAGQTERWNLTISGDQEISGGSSTKPGTATTTTSWTQGSADHWAMVAVSINPAAAGAGVIFIPKRHPSRDLLLRM
jgi:hypothetical protein